MFFMNAFFGSHGNKKRIYENQIRFHVHFSMSCPNLIFSRAVALLFNWKYFWS